MTKQELRKKLLSGQILDELFHFTHDQECLIFKADKFCTGDEIIYIADDDLNVLPLDKVLTDIEEIDEVLSYCYTGYDFIDECGGNVEKAERLFWYCNWQNPSTVNELDLYDEDFNLMLTIQWAEKIIRRLLSDNEQNIETATGGYDSGYAEGYHDALVDVMNQMGIDNDEEYYN